MQLELCLVQGVILTWLQTEKRVGVDLRDVACVVKRH